MRSFSVALRLAKALVMSKIIFAIIFILTLSVPSIQSIEDGCRTPMWDCTNNKAVLNEVL